MSNSAFSPSVLTVSSGTAGSGELNLITNPVAVTNTTGWVGAGRGTSGGPLNPTIETYFTVLNSVPGAPPYESSTSGAYDVLSLPSGLQNKKLKVEFYFTSPALDTFKVSVYKGTTRVPLTTDVSGSTALPQNTTGKFVAYFDTDSSGTWTVSITRTAGTGATALQFTNVVVGPGIQPQGAVVGEWVSFTPTGSWTTNTAYLGKWRRVGDSMELQYDISCSGLPTAGILSLDLPSGYSLDQTKFTQTASGSASGSWRARDAGVQTYGGPTEVNGGGTTVGVISLIIAAGGYASNAVPFAFNIGDRLEVWTTIPIAAWAGSGTVQLAQNDVEYAWNSGNVTAANTQDNTSFAYGPSGTPILAYNSTTLTGTSQTSFLVQFQTPIQAGDKLTIEIGNATTGWTDFSSFQGAFTGQANAVYGCQVIATSRTQARVYFGNAGQWSSGATYASAGAVWSGLSSYNWRVRKSSAGAAVGFGIVSPGVSSGLVSASGLPGNTTGNVVAAGYVGEVITATGTYTGVTTAGTTLATIPLTSGIWSITWSGSSIYSSGSVSALEWNIALTTNASLNPSVTDYYTIPATNIGFGNITSASTIQCRGNVSQTLTLLISGNTTYNFRAALTATGGGNIALKTTATAVRIA